MDELVIEVRGGDNLQIKTFKKGSDLSEFCFDHFLEFGVVLNSFFGLAVD